MNIPISKLSLWSRATKLDSSLIWRRRTSIGGSFKLILGVTFGAVFGVLCQGAEPQASTHSLAPVLSLRLTERYDSNVMLQDEGAQAGQDSFVTSVMPMVGGRIKGEGETSYKVCLEYAPDFTFFHDLSRESFLRHIGLFDFDVKHKGFSAGADVKAQYTDGSTDPPTWGTLAEPGGVPALGATEVRNRRRNMYFVSKFNGRQELGKTFLRGVFDARIWDFMTEDTVVPGSVIQNYYDRSDINGGVDFGVKLDAKLEGYVGYRLGHQDQEYRPPSLTQPYPYSFANMYHRFPIGLTTKPWSWFCFSGEIGPSFHFFDSSTIQPGANTQQNYLYFLVSGTVQLATNTTFKVAAGQHLLPASAGSGVFQNLTASGTLEHKFNSKLCGSFRFCYTDYDFDCTFAVSRWDRVYIPEAHVDYAFNKHFSAGAWYSYAWADSLIPNTSAREYTRHIVGIGLKATY